MVLIDASDLFEYAPSGFLSFTDDGNIVATNATLVELLGYSREELVGRSIESVLNTPSRIFYQTHFFPLVKLHGRANEIFLTLLSRDKAPIPVLTNVVRRNHEGAFVNHCVFVPVPQRKKYEEEILQAKKAAEDTLQNNETLVRARRNLDIHTLELDRRVGELEHRNEELTRLASILSHDLREPLRKAYMFTDILRLETEDSLSLTAQSSVEKIQSACKRMDQLLKALEVYLSIDAAKDRIRTVDLRDVVDAAHNQLLKRSEAKSLQLKIGSLPSVQGYRKQLVVLFYNLLENAVKFRRPGVSPRVCIHADVIQHNSYSATAGRYKYIDFARIVFADNGIGFDNRYADNVFTMLKKLDARSPGLGMGLPLCRKVVETHYGSISADSHPGQGTTFTILLPLQQEAS